MGCLSLGEAVHSPGASIEGRVHLWQKLQGTQPDRDAPWLVPVPPAGEQGLQPLLVDWLLWNAPLQNLREGDGRWRLRISIDGDSFLVDHQEALWLKGSNGVSSHDIQMELLNGLGEPITPVFNNQLVHLKTPSGPKPGWMRSRLNESQLARLSGSPEPETPETVEQPQEAPQKAEQPPQLAPVETETETDPIAPDNSDHETPQSPLAQDQATTEASQPTPAQEEPTDNDLPMNTSENNPPVTEKPTESLEQQAQAEAKLMPSSSLGGSARELLNSDGRLRKP